MEQHITRGSWVEIHQVILKSGERAPQVPEDTSRVPLEMKVKGFLSHDSRLGDEVEIRTPGGHRHTGRLIAVNPEYTHNFGRPVEELMAIGPEIKAILAKRREQ